MKPRVILYDLDGVVVNSQERFRNSGAGKAIEAGDYNEFRRLLNEKYASHTEGDVPLPFGIQLLDQMRRFHQVEKMIAVTARGEEGRGPTLKWLQQNMPWEVEDDLLIMRPAVVQNADGTYWRHGEPKFCSISYKRRVAREAKRDYEVVLAIDDFADIAHMYWELDIPTICLMVPGVDQGGRIQQGTAVIQG